MMNYETIYHIIWECSRFGTRGRGYKRGNTNPGSLRASEVGSIEVMPHVLRECVMTTNSYPRGFGFESSVRFGFLQ
jgi:hypothetical protein